MPGQRSARVVTLPKRATIEYAPEIRRDLLDAIENSASVVVDVSRLEAADLPTIHLLYAAAREALESDTRLEFDGDLGSELRRALEDGGFCKHAPNEGADLARALLELAHGKGDRGAHG